MSDYSFTYHDDGFSLDKAADAGLFIKLGKKEISFLIASQGRLLAWKDRCPLSAINEDEQLSKILTSPFKKVIVGLLPAALTLIPANLFIPQNTADYARYLDIKADNKAFTAKLDNENQLIYRVDKASYEELAAKIDLDDITVPADRGWINTIAKNEPHNHNIYADINAGQVSLLNFNGTKLHFYNCFKTDGITDVLYYCLFAAEQLNIKPDYTTLIVSGLCSDADVEQLSQFFSTVKYNDTRAIQASLMVPSHQVLSLAALA